MNSALYDYAPQIFERIRARSGDEIIAHGRTNSENIHDIRWEADEARLIREVTETFTRNEGKAPKGWLSGGSYENPWTVDLLKEAGYTYLCDWPADDQPFWMRTRSGPILSVPYPVELNDSPQIIHRQHTAREFCDMIVDQFEEMFEQSEKAPLVFNISIHPHTFGYPFRLRPLRVALEHCLSGKFIERLWKCTPGRHRGLLSDARAGDHSGLVRRKVTLPLDRTGSPGKPNQSQVQPDACENARDSDGDRGAGHDDPAMACLR